MKKFGFLLFTLLLVSGCNVNHKVSFEQIDASQAKEKLKQNNVLLVDVRTQGEYLEKHIPGALLLPLNVIETGPDKVKKLLPDKDAEILVYCRSGRRSQEAAEILTASGYDKIFDIGGINDWPYETVSGEE